MAQHPSCFSAARQLSPSWVWITVALLMLSLFGCSHWRESYLEDAVEEATQDEIVEKLGQPWKKKESILNGESTWIYRYTLTNSELDPMGINTLGKGVTQAANTAASLIGQGNPNLAVDKPQCFHYVLIFDQSKVLKNWTRELCSNTSL